MSPYVRSFEDWLDGDINDWNPIWDVIPGPEDSGGVVIYPSLIRDLIEWWED